MKGNKTLKKYLLFTLCSALIIGAATLYFHVSDSKGKTTIIIEPKQTITDPQYPEVSKPHETTHNKKATTTKLTSVAIKHSDTTTTEQIMLFIDINSANADELKKLSGIGEVLANDIVCYREQNGRFKNIEEIMNIHGIGEKTFEQIKDHIYVVDPIYEEIVEDINPESNSSDESEDHDDQPIYEEITTEYSPSLEDLAPININTAECEVLTLLPHIDIDTASDIIAFREKTGGFQNEYELLMINGLTKNIIADILPYITIE